MHNGNKNQYVSILHAWNLNIFIFSHILWYSMNMLVFLFLIPAAPAAKKAFAEEEPSATTKKVILNRN